MKKIILYLAVSLFPACIILAVSCSGVAKKNNSTSEIVFVGSTPGDSIVKSMLRIPPDQQADYIRWRLVMNAGSSDSNTFLLNVRFGEEQQGSPYFKQGGDSFTLHGFYTVAKHQTGNFNGDIYRLKSEESGVSMQLVRMNDNLFHLLTPDHQLMVGNGGFSYTLNRQGILTTPSSDLSSLTDPSFLLNDTAQEVVFEGRTPCRDFEKSYHLPAISVNDKIKWSITLYRDPVTFLPAIYKLKRIGDRIVETEGRWTLLKRNGTNTEAVIYQLDPLQPDKSVYFLAGSENVLFFLDRKQQLMAGNGDFSFTLNKKSYAYRTPYTPDLRGERTDVKLKPTVCRTRYTSDLRDLFGLSDAESILGETAYLKNSTMTVKPGASTYECAYIADSKDRKTGRTGAIYVVLEDYKELASAKQVYASIKTANKSHEGVKVLDNIGDEAYFHSDGQNFCFILVRKGEKILRMKINKVTSHTSLNQFNLIARNITASL